MRLARVQKAAPSTARLLPNRASGGKSMGEIPVESMVMVTMTGTRSGIVRTVPIGVEVVDAD
jgi:hypothetical protein